MRFQMLLFVAGFHSSALAQGDMIRLVESNDGLEFGESSERLFDGHSPSLVATPDGDWLLFYRGVDPDLPTASAELLMSRSRDEGRTWSAPQRSQVIGKRGIRRPGTFTVAALPDGTLRMIYARYGRRSDRAPRHDGTLSDRPRDGRQKWTLRIADSRKGLFFRDVGRAAALGAFESEPQAAMFFEDSKLHILAAEEGVAGKRSAVRHAVIAGERELVRLADADVQKGAAFRSIVETEKGFRAYGEDGDDIVSWSSRDGRDWSRDKAIRVEDAFQPAAVRKRGGSYVMVYVERRTNAPPAQRAIAETPSVVPAPSVTFVPTEMAASDDIELIAEDEETEREADASSAGEHTVVVGGGEPGEFDGESAGPAREEALAFLDIDDDEPAFGASSLPGFAPLPNFESPVDYIAWYRQALGTAPPGENASDAYAAIFSDWRAEAAGKDDWPEFLDMLNDAPTSLPKPWDPRRHTEWTESYEEVKDLINRYHDAATLPRYTPPAETSPLEGFEDHPPPLITLVLPALSHHRTVGRAILSDGWRLRDGKVDGKRMLAGWETVLRNAYHLKSGMTLIEELVGIAQQRLVQRDVLVALDLAVLSADQMRAARKLLREFDPPGRDAVISLRGEHAAVMDIIQFMYSSEGESDPAANRVRIEAIASLIALEESFDTLMSLDVTTSLNAFDEFYGRLGEMMAIGYPTVRRDDITALWEEYLDRSPLTQTFLPSLTRVHITRARSETARRATQLVYAIHIFEAEHDRWPRSLAEVPVEPGIDIRIDPFTGGFFGYRVEDDDFRLYSLSENARDDGGVHAPRWDDEPDAATGSDDFVFWPMQP